MTDTTANNDQNIADEVINHEQFIDMRDLLEDDFADLIQTYIVDSEQRIVALRTALANNDHANAFEIAHALKGSSANVGATQVSNISNQIQEACRAQDISQSSALIEALSVAWQVAKKEINQRLSQ